MKGSLCRLAETSFLWRDTAMRIRERFNPRAPCGARLSRCRCGIRSKKFQPTRPLRGATDDLQAPTSLFRFQPTRPLRGATSLVYRLQVARMFQPTRPLRGATYILGLPRGLSWVSTHAPLAGRDERHHMVDIKGDAVSTHAPLAGRDTKLPDQNQNQKGFNPRAPCGARPSRCKCGIR